MTRHTCPICQHPIDQNKEEGTWRETSTPREEHIQIDRPTLRTERRLIEMGRSRELLHKWCRWPTMPLAWWPWVQCDRCDKPTHKDEAWVRKWSERWSKRDHHKSSVFCPACKPPRIKMRRHWLAKIDP